MTDADFIQWLRSPQALRCVLVEVVANISGVDTTLYLSSSGFVTGPLETPANRVYAPCIMGGVTVSEELSLDGSASISYGDIEVSNADGERDVWLDYVWSNRAITVYIGDMRWPRADFRTVFSGVISDIGASNIDRLNLLMRDKSQKINTSMTEAVLGGTTANKDAIIPLCFGECHNISPLLVDPVLLEYQVHNGPIERLIEVRDNGVPVSVTEYLSTGKFRLLATPVGTVTASVQGAKPSGTYSNKVGTLIKHIATTYGSSPLNVSTEVDSAQITTFDAANTQPVGLYLSDRENVLDVCQRLAASVGAQVYLNPLGLLGIQKISLPAVGAPTAVSYTKMLENSITLNGRPTVIGGVKLGYCKNWTVQQSLQSGIPSEHIDLFGKEWLTVSATNSSVSALYSITEAPTQTDMLLLTEADTQTEANRRLALWSVKRSLIGYTGTPETMLQTLGSAQTLTHHRFGLGAGVTGQIIKQETDWMNLRTTVEVLV